MAVVAGHHDAVRELRPVPRARFFFAGERRQLDVFVAGIFGEAPQVGVGGFCGVHADKWGRGGSDGGVRAGKNRSSIEAGGTVPLWPGGAL
jgi:hypothetical protein